MVRKKRLIIINGTMGVGKTATSENLNKVLDNSVWLDGDWCWMMKPFVVNDETKTMVIDNIVHLLRNFIKTSHIENIIFNWVIDEEEIFELILPRLNDLEFNLYKFTLTCSEEVLINRFEKDIERGVRTKEGIKVSLARQEKFNSLSTIKINTDNKLLTEVVDEIKNIIN